MRSCLAKLQAALLTGLFLIVGGLAGSAGADDGSGRRAQPQDDKAEWHWRLPADDSVVYQGVSSFDQLGGAAGAMLYPAPNAVGLLAAVVTHGIIIGATRSGQRAKVQDEADKVLLPYRSLLDGLRYRDLMQGALARLPNAAAGRLLEPTTSPVGGLLVESLPVFSMTQDQRALLVDNLVVISPPGTPPENAYRNTIRVVAAAHDAADPQDFWRAGNGRRIKDESVRLLADSLSIAFSDSAAGTKQEELPFRTVRYREGSLEKMERAQVLVQAADHLLIRTLRGALMSVPVLADTR